MRKPAFCICENKGVDQLCSNCTADQGLCFHYTDSTIPLLPIFLVSSHLPSFCQTWSETRKTGFLVTWFIFYFFIIILLQLLDAEIRAHLLEKIGKPIDSQVHEVAMYLRYRGNYTDIVAEFLFDKGF